MLQRDLLMAGAGTVHGVTAGPLSNYLPAVLPMRTGARRADPELSFFDDRISILYVEEGGAAAPLSIDMATPDVDVPVNPAAPGCPSAGLCGFESGTRALIVQTADCRERLRHVLWILGCLRFDSRTSKSKSVGGRTCAPGNRSSGSTRVYYLDAATHRLMLYDGNQTDVALVENIVALRIEYFGDPWPGSVPRPNWWDGRTVSTAPALHQCPC